VYVSVRGGGLAGRHVWICYRCRVFPCIGVWVVRFGEGVWVGGLRQVFESGEQSFASVERLAHKQVMKSTTGSREC
jgi:hypothetical protein